MEGAGNTHKIADVTSREGVVWASFVGCHHLRMHSNAPARMRRSPFQTPGWTRHFNSDPSRSRRRSACVACAHTEGMLRPFSKCSSPPSPQPLITAHFLPTHLPTRPSAEARQLSPQLPSPLAGHVISLRHIVSESFVDDSSSPFAVLRLWLLAAHPQTRQGDFPHSHALTRARFSSTAPTTPSPLLPPLSFLSAPLSKQELT